MSSTPVVIPEGRDLAGANLAGADLQGETLQGANLQGANLRDANLHGANLKSAHLEDANLQGANLEGAILHGANLRCASLHGACLSGSNLIRLPVGDPRGYDAVACPRAAGWMIGAGCRWLSLDEALAHWGPKYFGAESIAALYLRALDWLVATHGDGRVDETPMAEKEAES